MKHYLILILATMLSFTAGAQGSVSDFDVSKDKEGATVYKGQFTFDDLRKEPSFGWFQRGAEAYKADTNAIKYLKKELPNYTIVVLMGTWCDDSQNLIPKLYKTLELTAYPMDKYAMFGVDRAKEAKYIEHKLYKVERVPTIILYKKNMEIGRIVESVKRSIEVDLVQLIQKDPEVQEAQSR